MRVSRWLLVPALWMVWVLPCEAQPVPASCDPTKACIVFDDITDTPSVSFFGFTRGAPSRGRTCAQERALYGRRHALLDLTVGSAVVYGIYYL